MKDQNDVVKEVLDCLKDYSDKEIRKEFLEKVEYIYTEDEQGWRQMRKKIELKRKL